jgi:hypothetical protein
MTTEIMAVAGCGIIAAIDFIKRQAHARRLDEVSSTNRIQSETLTQAHADRAAAEAASEAQGKDGGRRSEFEVSGFSAAYMCGASGGTMRCGSRAEFSMWLCGFGYRCARAL